MSSPDPQPARLPSLRSFALEAIGYALERGRPLEVDPSNFPEEWRAPAACFVTLRQEDRLRGCTGSFEQRPLVVSVARCAHRAAFGDPRFLPVTREELPGLETKVSVLGPPEPLRVASRRALLAELRPGRDGLILSEGSHRATFLPAVWDDLPEPADFLDALLRKAGLSHRYWSSRLRFERYATTDAP
jgi:AmmeMemoRadiSam system protein A